MLGTPVRHIFIHLFEVRRPTLNLDGTFQWPPMGNEIMGKAFAFCLLAFVSS